MRYKVLGAALASVLLAAGCGGSAAKSDQAQIKDAMTTFVNAASDKQYGKACEVTADPSKCLGQLALATAFLGDGGLKSVLPSDWQSRVEKAHVTVHGSRATFPSITPSDDTPDQFVKRDGEWLLVITDSSESDSSAGYPTAADAQAWPVKWCQVRPGMTLADADAIMGKPTGTFSDQHEWDGFQWSFTAFINSDGTIRQLDSTEQGATQATSHIPCGKPVIGVEDAKTRP
jgi:hypothetical protein